MAKKRKKRKGVVSAYNRHVGREMRAGKSMKQAAASWRGGRKKSPKRRLSRPSRKSGSVRRRAPAKKVRKVGRSGFNQQKLFKLARMAALLGPHAGVWMGAGTPQDKVSGSIKLLSGFDINTGQFSFEALAAGYVPLLATTAVTKVIPKISGLIGGLM